MQNEGDHISGEAGARTNPPLQSADVKLTEAVKKKLATLPTSPGVYHFKDKDQKIIYIGKAKNLRARVQSYFRNLKEHNGKTRMLVKRIADFELIITSSEVEALILENNLIKQFKPRYNINLKDDKSYPYICVTNERFPRVFATRTLRRDGSKYFGPYTEVRQMKLLLEAISDIFQVRSCSLKMTPQSIKAGKFKVCLDYHIKKCLGPCEGYQSEEDYNAMIDEVIKLLKGKTRDLVHSLTTRMKAYAKDLQFEYAAELKRQLEAIDRYSSKQRVVTTDEMDRDIFAIAREDDDACGTIFKVRDGKLLGSQHFYFSNIQDEQDEVLISKLMEKFYIDTTDILPDEIYCPVLPANLEAIEALTQKRLAETGLEKKIKVVVPQIGDKAKLVTMCKANARHLLGEYKIQKQKRGEAMAIPRSVNALQRDLQLKTLPRRIECFDNSNFQGEDAVASMVCFVDGKPRKSDYRKFHIKTVKGPDDFASMAEIIERRYFGTLSNELDPPDLIVVDGGKGQLSSAYAVLKEKGSKVPVIGLAKRFEEVFFPNEQFSHNLPKTSSSIKLLQQVRDEAHRFAITFHREKRSKRTLQTELTTIKGIGPGKAKKLLTTFGSVAEIKTQSLEALAKVVGRKAGTEIRRYFDQAENKASTDEG